MCHEREPCQALFCDTIPDTEASILTDEAATVASIRQALDDTPDPTDPEDVVIISFSGHGTHDHRIVTFDTALDALADTTISMEELETRFKESGARAVLCILDCCFSGGAPARILENNPISRDPRSPLEAFAGRGRILISAANINEFAYELPGSGQGLLSKALIDLLQGPETVVSVPSIMDQVMERVRAEAAQIGVVQTPVLFGYVEGG